MQAYRVYWVDGQGHIEKAEWIEAVDDGAAVRKLEERRPAAAWELWRGRERLAKS